VLVAPALSFARTRGVFAEPTRKQSYSLHSITSSKMAARVVPSVAEK